jgi:hypothetical protein
MRCFVSTVLYVLFALYSVVCVVWSLQCSMRCLVSTLHCERPNNTYYTIESKNTYYTVETKQHILHCRDKITQTTPYRPNNTYYTVETKQHIQHCRDQTTQTTHIYSVVCVVWCLRCNICCLISIVLYVLFGLYGLVCVVWSLQCSMCCFTTL